MKKIYILVGFIMAFSVFTTGTIVFAEDYGLSETAGAAKLNTNGSVPTIAGNIIGGLLSMISVLFFVLVLYGGIIWMTARGNSEKTEKALDTIIAATIGIIIIMGAYALTNFVFKVGTGTNGGGGNNSGNQGNNTPSGPTLSCIADAGYCAPFSENTCDDNYCVYLSNDGCVPKVQTACTNLSQQQCSGQAHCVWGTGDNSL